MRWARCGHCFEWRPGDKLTMLQCPACFYSTARCNKGDCNGIRGAVRSIQAHFHYWAGRGEQLGGHSARMKEWENYKAALASITGEGMDDGKQQSPRKLGPSRGGAPQRPTTAYKLQ